ncbi:MAG: sodium ion-translocating decarboxylase subunit beta, partial [Vallitaleaceae bacterium]|nr:sodium ion-translocating decarboxylase subunit beta [Vallitaleaceae bacterium]
MWIIGATLIYLAVSKDYEPALLLPIGFGAILVNIPLSSMVTQEIPGYGSVEGIVDTLFKSGIATEIFPLLLFVGIGAMIDFGPLLSNPKMLFFGAAAQFGIFGTLLIAV